MVVLSNKEIEAAAKWWSNELAIFTDHDAGDSQVNMVMSFSSNLAQKNYTSEQVEAFEKALIEVLTERVNFDKYWYPTIHNDYGLDIVLQEAGEKAGLKLTSFDLPIKTVMWLQEGRVAVSKGYGAPSEDIYNG